MPFLKLLLPKIHSTIRNRRYRSRRSERISAAHFYATAFGMRLTAYSGPETGARDVASSVLESGGARFVFSGPVRAGTELGEHVARHGDGVFDIALRVPDAQHVPATAQVVLRDDDPVARAVAQGDVRDYSSLMTDPGLAQAFQAFFRNTVAGECRDHEYHLVRQPLGDLRGVPERRPAERRAGAVSRRGGRVPARHARRRPTVVGVEQASPASRDRHCP